MNELASYEVNDADEDESPPEIECLDRGYGECQGKIEYRMALSGSGRSFARCDRHWERRLREWERTQERYGGVCAPHDFDPGDAGESWDED